MQRSSFSFTMAVHTFFSATAIECSRCSRGVCHSSSCSEGGSSYDHAGACGLDLSTRITKLSQLCFTPRNCCSLRRELIIAVRETSDLADSIVHANVCHISGVQQVLSGLLEVSNITPSKEVNLWTSVEFAVVTRM
jgi:hypothetical protein